MLNHPTVSGATQAWSHRSACAASASPQWPRRSPSCGTPRRRPTCRARTGSGCWSTARPPAATTSALPDGWLRGAKLRQAAVVEDTDYRTPRGLDRALFLKLAGCGWIREHAHVVIGGPTGVGKSWLACALGHKACREGYSVLYKRAPRLFADLATARGEGRLPRLLATLERTRLLIIDASRARRDGGRSR